MLKRFGAITTAAIFLAGSPALFGQAKTTVSDTFVGPNGAPVQLRMSITPNSTFTSADGFVVPVFSTATVGSSGSFSVNLVPNTGTIPAGSSYRVDYSLNGIPFHETWVVPQSSSPIKLAAVRTLLPPPLSSISPAASPGDLYSISSTLQLARVPANTSASPMFLSQSSSAVPTWVQPNFSQIAGTLAPNQVPNLSDLNGSLDDAKLAASYSGAGSCPANQFAVILARGITPTCAPALTASAAPANQFATAISSSGGLSYAQPSFANLSGTASDAQLAGGYSGTGSCPANQFAVTLARNTPPICAPAVAASAAPSNNFATGISFSGTLTYSQPGFANLSGSAADAQLANPYSGVGACAANQFTVSLSRNAAPSCAAAVAASNAPANQFATAISASGALSYAQANFANLSGTAADAQLASAYSGVGSCSNKAMTGLARNAAPSCSTVTASYVDTSIALPSKSTDSLQYVSSSGNDANDGLSSGRAKATWFAAAEALPGGSASPPTAGSGTIYIADGASANPTANAGMWLMCSSDANYANPPAGWLRESGSLATLGIPKSGAGNNHKPAAHVIAGGSSANYPAVWLSGCANQVLFKDLSFSYPYVGIRMGVSSNGDRTAGQVQNVTFENVSVNHGQSCTTCGPSVDIGSNVFWVWFRDGSYTGALNHLFSVSSAVRASGVVTLTTSTNHLFTVGQRIAVGGYADTSWNGTFTVASVPAANQITYSQPYKPDATAPSGITGVNPIVIDDYNPAFLIDPGSGAGSGNIYLSDMVMTGGGVRFYPGNQTNGLDLDRVQTEITAGAPIVWFSQLSTTNARVKNLIVNDATAPSVEVDRSASGTQGSGAVVATDAGNIIGDVLCGAGCSTAPGVSPAISNPGNYLGTFYGQVDASRRNFTPTVARFTNLVSQIPSGWTGTGVTTTTGITAPDGTTNAGQISSTGGEVNAQLWSAGMFPSAGDWFVACTWARSVNANGYDRNAALQFNGPGGFALDTGTNTFQVAPTGNGQWGWACGAHKVMVGTNGSYSLISYLKSSPAQTDQLYAPVLLQIPAAAGWSDNEVAEYVQNLQSYPDTAGVGDVSMLRGERLSFSAPNSSYFGKFTSAPWTADRTYTWPDSAGTVCLSGVNCMAGTGGSSGQFLYNNSGPAGGAANLTLNSTVPTFANFYDITKTAAPANPASGAIRLYADSTTGNLQCLNSIGGNCNPSSGGGTPGGSTTQLQYNNGGAFGGLAGWTTDGTSITGTTSSNSAVNLLTLSNTNTGSNNQSTVTIANDGTAKFTLSWTGNNFGSSLNNTALWNNTGRETVYESPIHWFTTSNGATTLAYLNSTGFAVGNNMSPASLFNVGSTNQFQMNGSGQVTKYNNVSESGSIPAVTSCGTTTTCAGTVQYTPKMLYGTVPLTAGTATVGSLPFASSTSFVCHASRTVTTGLSVTNASPSSVTFTSATNTDTDTVSYFCVGT
jgi:hypothetical protein